MIEIKYILRSPSGKKTVISNRSNRNFENLEEPTEKTAMDVFFHEDHDLLLSTSSDSSLFWPDEYPAPVLYHLPATGGSSFVPCTGADASGSRERAGPSRLGNMNRRVLEFARRSWPESARNQELVTERGYRHMMSERMRREKQKQSYSALHSLLPRGTKVIKPFANSNFTSDGSC